MRTLILLLSVTLSWGVYAASERVYKRTNEEGVTEFSDTPGDDAKVIKVPKSSTYTTPQTPATSGSSATPSGTSEESQANKPVTYETLEIISPQDDEGVRSNAGNITVQAKVEPSLSGYHRLRWMLDNQVIEGTNSLSLNLTNIDRGTHTVQVSITDDQGKEIISSDTITFHILRATAR